MGAFTYVYILQSETCSDRFYVGQTQDLRVRLAQRDAGRIPRTTKWKPWRIKSYAALSDKQRARALEHYLPVCIRACVCEKALVSTDSTISAHVSRAVADLWSDTQIWRQRRIISASRDGARDPPRVSVG